MLALPAERIFDVGDMQKDDLSSVVAKRYILSIEVYSSKIRSRTSCDRPVDEPRKSRKLKITKRVIDPAIRDLLLFEDMTVIPLSRSAFTYSI